MRSEDDAEQELEKKNCSRRLHVPCNFITILPSFVQKSELSAPEMLKFKETFRKLQQASADNSVIKMPKTARAMSVPTSEQVDIDFNKRTQSKDIFNFFEYDSQFLEQSQMLLSKG